MRKNNINITGWKNPFWGLMIGFIIIGLPFFAFSLPANASYMPFNTNVKMNVGIGTSSPGSNLSVLGGASFGSYATSAAPVGGIIASGNVGIGTATTAQSLDVNGNIGITGVGSYTGNDTVIDGNFYVRPGKSISLYGGAWASAVIRESSQQDINGLQIYTGASTTPVNVPFNLYIGSTSVTTPALTVSSSNNVGIGSTAPSGALDVGSGSICLGHTCNSTWPASGSNYWSLTAGAGNVGISTTNTVGIGTTAGVGAGLVVMNGNVGIGTWIPGSALAVAGNITTTNNGSFITAQGSSLANNLIVHAGGASVGIDSGGVSSGQNSSLGFYQGQAGGVSWNGTANGTAFTFNPSASGTITKTGGQFNVLAITPNYSETASTASNTDLLINRTETNIGTGSQRLIDAQVGGVSKFVVLNTGNIGVGSLTPGQTVDVQGTVRTIGFVMSGQSPLTGEVLTAIDSTGNATWSSAGSVGTNYWLNTTGVGNVGISTTNTVGIGTTSAGAGAGLVVMNGNVGIGTWVPNSRLHVAGITAGGTGLRLDTIYDGNLNYWLKLQRTGLYGIGYAEDTGGDVLAIDLSNNETLFTFPEGITHARYMMTPDANGRTSIGLPASSYNSVNAKLHIYSGAATTIDQIVEGFPSQSADLTEWQNSSGIPLTVVDKNGNIGIGTFAVNNSLIVASGNVGIGSVAPGTKMDVQGTVRATGFVMSGQSPLTGEVLTAIDSTGNATWSSAGSVGTNYWLNTTGVGNVGISTTNTVGIGTTSAGAGAGLVVMNGNVGIGTWKPAKNLDIKGSGSAELTVEAGWDSGAGTWINVSTDGPSGIGSGGAGTDPWIAYVASGGEWFSDSNSGDIAYRNTNGNLLFGTSPGNSVMQIEGSSITTGSGTILDDGEGDIWPGSSYQYPEDLGTLADSNGNLYYGDGSELADSNHNLYYPNSEGVLAHNGAIIYGQGTGSGSNFVDNNNHVNLQGRWLTSNSGNNGIQIDSNGNVGIGTLVPIQLLEVGNRKFDITSGGNVGIGSTSPAGTLDVGSGSICLGHTCNSTWPASGSNYWSLTAGAGNVGISTTNTVGIGTTSAGVGAGLVVMNGNVGIGTWVPAYPLEIDASNGGGGLQMMVLKNTTAASGPESQWWFYTPNASTSGDRSWGMATNHTIHGSLEFIQSTSNSGLPTGQSDGGFTNNGNFVLSSGTSMAEGNYRLDVLQPGSVGALRVVSGISYFGGNVGIGTTTPQTSFVSMGNVGIGTWTAAGGNLIVNGGGNVGINTVWPGTALDVTGTVRATAFIGNGAQLTGISATSWTDVTTTTQSIAVNTGYIADNASLVTMTLPTTAAVGTEINIVGGLSDTGLWKIAQNSGQTIHFGSVNTTTGTSGYLSSSGQYDSVQLLCVKANTDFVVISSQGNINWN